MQWSRLSKISLKWHNAICVFASIVSLVYYFALKNPCEIILWVIYIVDFLLFALSAYRFVSKNNLTKVKTIIFTVITMMAFLFFWQIVMLAYTDFEYTINMFFKVLRFSLFLSPSLILLIPVMEFIGEIIS